MPAEEARLAGEYTPDSHLIDFKRGDKLDTALWILDLKLVNVGEWPLFCWELLS